MKINHNNRMRERFLLVEYMRGAAIFTIVLMTLVQNDLTGSLHKAASFGGSGIHVLILLLGFSLYMKRLIRPLGYGAFLLRRFLPTYVLYAVAVAMWAIWMYLTSGPESVDMEHVKAHLLLYKMFDSELCVSLCSQYWFVSTIIQFYLLWPLIVRLAQVGEKGHVSWLGPLIALGISFVWWITVWCLDYDNMRPWCSCCLQYLWEFVLGMWLAQKYYDGNWYARELLKGDLRHSFLVLCAIVGMVVTVFMTWYNEWKLFNDVPSLLGYGSVLLLMYDSPMRYSRIKRFFIWSSGFWWELYLSFSLSYTVVAHYVCGWAPVWVYWIVALPFAYGVAWLYHIVTMRIVKN